MTADYLQPTSGGKALPVRVPLLQGPSVFGVSRSGIYRAAAAGHVKLTKLGKTTLIDTASMLAFLDSLPTLTPRQAA